MNYISENLKTCIYGEYNQWGGFWNISFNYEYMKSILEEKNAKANVEVLYNTTFFVLYLMIKLLKGLCLKI